MYAVLKGFRFFLKGRGHQGLRASRGVPEVPEVPGGPSGPGVLGVSGSQDWVPLFYHAHCLMVNIVSV